MISGQAEERSRRRGYNKEERIERRRAGELLMQPRTVLSEPAAMPRFAETSAREGLVVIINLRGDAFAK